MINISKIRQLTPLQKRFLQCEYIFYKLSFEKSKDYFPSEIFSEKVNGAKMLSCLNLKVEGRYSYVFMFHKADAAKINILKQSYRQKYAGIGLSTSVLDFGELNIAQQYQLLLGAILTTDNNASGTCYYVVDSSETSVKTLKVTFGIYGGFLTINLPAVVTFRKKQKKAVDDKYKYYISGYCVNKDSGNDVEKERLCYLPQKHDYSDKKRNTMAFHKLLFDEKFKGTKLYVLYFIGKKFNTFYKDIIEFPFPDYLFTVGEFMDRQVFTDGDKTNILPKIKTNLLDDSFCLKGKKVRLVDDIGDEDSTVLIRQLHDLCVMKGLKVVKGRADYSVQLVHNEKYYKIHRSEEDAYNNDYYQHLTLETLKASVRTYNKDNWDKTKLPPEIKTLFWEMIITNDILHQQCTTIGEHDNDINIGANFYLSNKKERGGMWHHGTMLIDKDNRIFFADETSLCNDMGYMLLDITGKKNASVILVAVGKNIACIEETSIFLIPDNYDELVRRYDDFRKRRFPFSVFNISLFLKYLESASVKEDKREKLVRDFTEVTERISERYPGKDDLSIFELLSVITEKSCRYYISGFLNSNGLGELFAHEREQENLERYYGNMKGIVFGVGKLSDKDDYYYAAPDGEGIGQNPFDKAIRIFRKWDVQGSLPTADIIPYLTAGWYTLDNTSWPCIKKYLEEWLKRKYKNKWIL